MPIIRRIGLTTGFERFKNGQVIEDVKYLILVSDELVKKLETGKSEGAIKGKKVFQDLNTAVKALEENLNQIGAMVYPGVADTLKWQFRGERLGSMTDYGKEILPVFKEVRTYCKENPKAIDALSQALEKHGDLKKTIPGKIGNIDNAMRIISNKLS